MSLTVQGGAAAPSPMSMLNEDDLVVIFGKLPVRNLGSVGAVCKQFKKVLDKSMSGVFPKCQFTAFSVNFSQQMSAVRVAHLPQLTAIAEETARGHHDTSEKYLHVFILNGQEKAEKKFLKLAARSLPSEEVMLLVNADNSAKMHSMLEEGTRYFAQNTGEACQ